MKASPLEQETRQNVGAHLVDDVVTLCVIEKIFEKESPRLPRHCDDLSTPYLLQCTIDSRKVVRLAFNFNS